MDRDHKQSFDHLNRTVLIIAAVVAFLIFSIWQATAFFGAANQMDQRIAAFYDQDTEHLTLNSKVSQGKIDQLQKQVDQLPLFSRAYYSNQVDDLKRQYDNYQEATKLFDSEGNLSPDLDPENVQAIVKDCQRGALTTNACTLYQEAQASLTHIQEAKQAIDQLPEEISVRGDLMKSVQAIQQIEEEFQYEIDQPQAEEIRDKLSRYARHLADGILAAGQYGDYDADQIEVMNSSEFLKAELRGTMYDTDPLISLTFDDGPNPEFTPQVLEVLKKHNVKATFFLLGSNVEQYPELAKRIVAEGHQVGNHSYNHPDLRTLTDAEIKQQFEWGQEVIEEAVGFRPDIYRLPFGAGGARVVKLMKQEGMTSILWNVDTMDWSSHDADSIIQVTEQELQKHSLILMHDSHAAAAPALERMIPMLKERGYHFVKPQDLSFQMRYFAE